MPAPSPPLPHPPYPPPLPHHLSRIRPSPPPTTAPLSLPPLADTVPLSPRPQHHRPRPSPLPMNRDHPPHHHHLPPPGPPPPSLGGPAVNPPPSTAPSAASSAHHHHHHHHHHHQGQPQHHPHSHPSMGPGVPPPPQQQQPSMQPHSQPPGPSVGASASGSGRGQQHHHGHAHGHTHTRTHSGANGFPPREQQERGRDRGDRDRERGGGRDRGMSTSSHAGGPPPSSGASTLSIMSTSTVGPGVAGPMERERERDLRAREREREMQFQRGQQQQQITFQHHPPPRDRERERDVSMHPPPQTQRERDARERDLREREREREIQMHHHHHAAHSQAPTPTPPSSLTAVVTAANAISSSGPGGIWPAQQQHPSAPPPPPPAPSQAAIVSGPGMPGMAPSTPMQPNGVVNGSVNGMPPDSRGVNGAAADLNGVGGRRPVGSMMSVRLGESMDLIRAEYDGLVNELGAVRGARDEWEGKVVSQVNELVTIRKALYELEAAHGRVRESFELEIGKLKQELRVAKQQQVEMQQRELREREIQQQAHATTSQPPSAHGFMPQRPPPPPPPPPQQQPQEHGLPPSSHPHSHPHPHTQHPALHIQLGGPGQPPQMGPPGPSGTVSGRTTPSAGAGVGLGRRGERERERERESPRVQSERERERESGSVFYRPGGRDDRLSRDERLPRDERVREERVREESLRQQRDRDRDTRDPMERDMDSSRPRDRNEERMWLERMREREKDREREGGGREAKRVRVGSLSGSGAGTPRGGLGQPGTLSRPPTQEGMYAGPGTHHPQRPSVGGLSQQQQLQQGGGPIPMQHGVPTPRFPPVPGTVNTGGVAIESHTQMLRDGGVGLGVGGSGLGSGSGHGVGDVQGAGDMDVDVDDVDVEEPRVVPDPTTVNELGVGGGGEAGGGGEMVVPFPGMMDSLNAPPELKKDGSDWFVLYNPRKVGRAGVGVGMGAGAGGRKQVDVSLVYSLVHESVVCCVKFSADGKYLATGSNRSAQIYSTQNGQKVCTLVDEDAISGKQGDLYIRSVCFSPCGRWLATGAEDKVVRIWDIKKQKIRSVFDGHQQEIYALEFSLDGRLLVSGSGDKTARVWDVTSVLGGSSTPENGSSPVDQTQPTVLTIGDSLAERMPELDVDGDEDVGMGEGEGKKEGEERGEDGMDVEGSGSGVQGEGGVATESSADPGITSIAVSPDGRYVAAGSLDSVIRLWDLRPRSTSKSPVGSVPGSSSSSPAEPKLIERLKGHKDSVYSVSFTRDGRFLVSASLDKGVRVWDVGHLGIVPAPAPVPLPLPGSSSSSHPSSSSSSSSSSPSDVGLGLGLGVGLPSPPPPGAGAPRKTRCVTQFVGHRDFVLSVAVSHDGRWVVSGSKDRGVMWWELGAGGAGPESERERERGMVEEKGGEGVRGKDREAVCVLQGHKNSVISIDLSPVGNMLATGSGDWQARIWTYKTE